MKTFLIGGMSESLGGRIQFHQIIKILLLAPGPRRDRGLRWNDFVAMGAIPVGVPDWRAAQRKSAATILMLLNSQLNHSNLGSVTSHMEEL